MRKQDYYIKELPKAVSDKYRCIFYHESDIPFMDYPYPHIIDMKKALQAGYPYAVWYGSRLWEHMDKES